MDTIEEDRMAFEKSRVYLPSAGKQGVSQDECLDSYIEREFPEAELDKNAVVYSVPRTFASRIELQGSSAEELVFERLANLSLPPTILPTRQTKDEQLWVLFFHGATYAAHSYRNHRVGKLMIREHDFVIFTKYKDIRRDRCMRIEHRERVGSVIRRARGSRTSRQYYVTLAEVKSTYVGNVNDTNTKISSDSRVVKNNKRSAQHQLRDHVEMLGHLLGTHEDSIQCYIIWPYLNAYTKDSKQVKIPRWKEDGNLHVFEHCCKNQYNFNDWFMRNVLTSKSISKTEFDFLLRRFVVLSSGVFVDEIHRGILTLLTQEQLALLTSSSTSPNRWGKGRNGPLVVHGAAGTGKTLLVIRKLQLLYERNELSEEKRALYICYWPGLRCDFHKKLKKLPFGDFVDSSRFYISQTGFLKFNKRKYKHIFVDEAEVLRLCYNSNIVTSTFLTIYKKYHDGNCNIVNCSYDIESCSDLDETDQMFKKHIMKNWGELWFLVDTNQTMLFSPIQSPKFLQTPNIILNNVMRTTRTIYNVFQQFYSHPMTNNSKLMKRIPHINIGHNIIGPPIFWVDTNENVSLKSSNTGFNKILCTLASVVIDLIATKGIKPNDVCVIPFFMTEIFTPANINEQISGHFVEGGYKPNCVTNIEDFITNCELKDFLIIWGLRTKGLEFKVVIIVIEDEDFEIYNAEDRKKMYIMASRCTCLLILLSSSQIKDAIDPNNSINSYTFGLDF